MAIEKKKQPYGLTRSQLTKVWEKIGTDGWLAMLTEGNDGKKSRTTTRVSPGVIQCLCPNPDHQDTDPSFFIHTHGTKNFAHCFGSTCLYHTTSPIELASKILQRTDSDALQHLKEKFSLSHLPRKVHEELVARKTNQEVKRAIYNAAHEYMCKALATPNDPKYQIAQEGVEWLTSVRHVSKGILPSLPVGIVPPLTDLNKILTDQLRRKTDTYLHKKEEQKKTGKDPGPAPADYVTEAVKYLEPTFRDPAYNGSILWPLHTGPKTISRLKLRTPDSTVRHITMPDDEFDEDLGFYGLGWDEYADLLYGPNKKSQIVIVEGEMDAMSVMAKFLESGTVTFPVVSAGGSGGSAHIEPILSGIGIDTAYLVGDSPEKDSSGDKVVQEWLSKIDKLHAKIFVGWDALRPGSDFDEVINIPELGIDKLREVVWDKLKDNFIPPWKWAFEQAQAELVTYGPDDHRQLVECATTHGRYLKNILECDKYVDQISDAFPVIPKSTLKLDISKHESTELGYVTRIRETFKEMFYVVGTHVKDGNRRLILYHRKNKHYHPITIDSAKSIQQELAPLVGSLTTFATSEVGYPEDLLPSLAEEGQNLKKVKDALSVYVTEAVNDLAKGTVNINAAPRLRQGYHYAIHPDTGAEAGEYIVCGKDVFSIKRENDDAVAFEELQGPEDKGFIFHGDFDDKQTSPWFPGGLNVEELERGSSLNLGSLYKDIQRFLGVGFKFKNREVTEQLLAAVLLTLPVMDCFDRPLIMFVTGETSSGKSMLLSTFGGEGDRNLKLLHCAQGWAADYSPSSVAQHGDNDGRLIVLDEFESNGTNHKVVASIFELYRGLVNGATTRTKSLPHGTGTVERHLKHPVLLGGIAGAEREQDLNRIIQIEMEKVEYKEGVPTEIRKHMGYDKVKQMANDIAICMYPHVPKLRAYAQQIAEEFSSVQEELEIKMEYRYASGLFGVLAVMKLVGLDWKDFLKRYASDNAQTLTAGDTASESDNILHAMLTNQKVQDPDTRTYGHILAMLRDPAQWDAINTSATGVYFDSETRCLLILVDAALTSLVPDTYKRGLISSAHRLRTMLTRHSKATAKDAKALTALGILENLEHFIGRGITERNVVVIDAAQWLRNPKAVPTQQAPAIKPQVASATPEMEAQLGKETGLKF